MQVVIAEKPSVARDLARVLGARQSERGRLVGSGLCVTWCHGHMAELEQPAEYDPKWKHWDLATLPMVPERFRLALRRGAEQQFAVLRSALLDPEATGVVNACDAGREGELIFRYVYELSGCRLPVRRLWVSSLTAEAVRAGWKALRPGRDFDDLAAAARSRAEADWLVGLNGTRALTCASRVSGGSQLWSVGRVQTPTLALIVARDREIEAFVPEDFWQVKAQVEAGEERQPRRFEAIWFRRKVRDEGKRDRDTAPKSERLASVEAAEQLVAAIAGRPATVVHAKRKRTVEQPPLLYDLTSLQRRANQRYGLSAQRTLEVAQELYERHKLLTYPRTDARYLTSDQVPDLPRVVQGLGGLPVYAPTVQAVLAAWKPPGRRVVNDKEVGDHHAIIPTGTTPRPAALSADCKRVFDLVARRFLAALSEPAWFDDAALVLEVPTDAPLPDGCERPPALRAKGRVCVREGWRAVDPPARKSKDRLLPAVEVGEAVLVVEARPHAGKTRPPRPHNDATLLRAMETAGRALDDRELARALRARGLGTPATRAAILQTLLDRGFVVRAGRILQATERGCAVIDAIEVPDLKSAALTGQWEGRLTDIAEGRGARDAFMRDVAAWVADVVGTLGKARPPLLAGEEVEPSLGPCPACGAPVRARGKVYACATGRSCPFVVFGQTSKRAISARTVRQLLKEGRSAALKGFRSKKGNEFRAGLEWSAEQQKVVFWFPPRVREGDACPTCGTGRIIRGKMALGCSRWREGCGFRV